MNRSSNDREERENKSLRDREDALEEPHLRALLDETAYR
jgi:hypothetical protein